MLKWNGFPGMFLFVISLIAVTSVLASAEDFEGLIYPSEVVKVSSQVPGILEEVVVERGDQVRKGQVLARLKSGQEKASLELVRANVEFLKRKTERNVELARKKLISANENDELVTELRKAELAVGGGSGKTEAAYNPEHHRWCRNGTAHGAGGLCRRGPNPQACAPRSAQGRSYCPGPAFWFDQERDEGRSQAGNAGRGRICGQGYHRG